MKRLTTLAMTAAMTLGAPLAAQATVLTFDVNPDVTNSQVVDQNYGDRVTDATTDATGTGAAAAGSYGTEGGATGNVVIDYFGSDPSLWRNGYNDLTNVFYDEDDGSNSFGFTLTADAGFNVTLERMDIGNFGGALTVPTIEVTTNLGTDTFFDVVLASAGLDALTLDFMSTATQFVTVTISTLGLGGASDNVGLDNIQFSQSIAPTSAVPLPAGLPLLLAGLGAFGLVRRKHS